MTIDPTTPAPRALQVLLDLGAVDATRQVTVTVDVDAFAHLERDCPFAYYGFTDPKPRQHTVATAIDALNQNPTWRECDCILTQLGVDPETEHLVEWAAYARRRALPGPLSSLSIAADLRIATLTAPGPLTGPHLEDYRSRHLHRLHQQLAALTGSDGYRTAALTLLEPAHDGWSTGRIRRPQGVGRPARMLPHHTTLTDRHQAATTDRVWVDVDPDGSGAVNLHQSQPHLMSFVHTTHPDRSNLVVVPTAAVIACDHGHPAYRVVGPGHLDADTVSHLVDLATATGTRSTADYPALLAALHATTAPTAT